MESTFLATGGVKNLSDLIQVLVLSGGLFAVSFWVVAIILAWQVVKMAFVLGGWSLSTLKKVLISFGHTKAQIISTLLFILAIAITLNVFRRPLMDELQYFEQAYLKPTYLNTDTSVWTIQAYEQEIKKYVGESEFETVQQWTRKTAAAIGSTPLAIYEVAYSECGLNPFAANLNERGDTVAFGWIQFTPAGCIGTTVGGNQINMKQVKGWSRTRNVSAMMEATHTYLVGRANGVPLPTSTDVYLAVFAPGMIGQGDGAVLYSARGAKPSQYWQNVGLDGYGLEGDKIIHAEKYRDGKITRGDMGLHLALKKARFLRIKPT